MGHRRVFAGVLATVVVISVPGCADSGHGGVLPMAPSALSGSSGPSGPSGLSGPNGGPATMLDNAPFRGEDTSGTFELLQSGCAEGLTPLTTHTSGTATLIGAYTFETRECFDTNALTFSGTFTITAANGDTLVGTLAGHGIAVLEDGTAKYEFTATITGWTGRFAAATGTFSATGKETWSRSRNRERSPERCPSPGRIPERGDADGRRSRPRLRQRPVPARILR